MTPGVILPLLLAIAALIGWARVAWRQARAPAPIGRFVALLALQPVCAALLWRVLTPVPGADASVLTVATANAPPRAAADVALPEAPPGSGRERVPDLATALARHPRVATLRILGDGLEPRDRDAAATRALVFAPQPTRRGIVAIVPPPVAAPGAALRASLRVADVPGGSVVLLDPAGTIVDRQPLSDTGEATLAATARQPGAALFRLRVLDRAGTMVEEADLPVVVEDMPSPRLLILAGAPGPEVKYLRRWATDAGLAVTVRAAVGGGATIGDVPLAIDTATLARVDAIVVDERSWAALAPAARAAIAAAVRGGVGLVVRPTGAVPDATRRQWQALGVALAPGAATAPAPLASGVPILTRRVDPPGPTAVPLWRDARGATLADWRAVGRGRVALWSVADAFTLVLAGHHALYDRAWSDVLAAVARPAVAPRATLPPLPRAGERVALCGIPSGARVEPDGAALAIDPASGAAACAAYYPRDAGWHRLVTRSGVQAFYVHPADALPAARAAERTDATLALRRAPAGTSVPATVSGGVWPWFAALLAALALLWWLERRGRARPR